MKRLLLVLGLAAISAGAQAQPVARPEILILGTFHMANPGHDLANMEADDVLSPKRQQEMAQLMDVLKKFRPTKVTIEAAVGTKRIAQQYADYLAGKYVLTRNENDQIGFRLAKEMGHTTIHAVDEDGDFPYLRVRNWAKANGREKDFAAREAALAARVKEEGDFLRTHTLVETLGLMNSDSSVARAVAEYYEWVPFGEPYEYAGPDLLAAWFTRNIRIYRNIVALADSPNERVLVIYGAGHLGWLRQDVANDARMRLRKLSEFTSPSGRAQIPDTAAVRRELTQRYNENNRAFLAKDVRAIMALRAPDFHTVGPDTMKRDRAGMEQYTIGLLNGIDRWISLTIDIDSLEVVGDLAHALTHQHADRMALRPDGKVHHVETWVIQRETWRRTPAGWLLYRVDGLRDQRRLVDGQPG